MVISQQVLMGDSIPQATGPTGTASTYGQGGKGSFPELLRDRFGAIPGFGPLLGPGVRGTWLGLVGSNTTEWTFAGAWTTTLATDAWDKSPYGGSAIGGNQWGNGIGVTALWTKPAWMPSIVAIAVDIIDKTNSSDAQYRIDGGTWTNIGQTLLHDNKWLRFHLALPVTSTIEFRCYNGSIGVDFCPVDVEPYFIDPLTATSGYILHDIAINGSKLHEMFASTNGDRMAFFGGGTDGPIKLGTGSPIRPTPNAGTINWNINDVSLASTSGWNTDLGLLNTRVGGLGPLMLISGWEANTASYNQTQQTNYRAQTKTSAAAFSTPAKVLDFYDAWAALGFTANAGAVTAGFLAADGIHQSQAGNIDIADRVYWFVRNTLTTTKISGNLNAFAVGKSALGSATPLGGQADGAVYGTAATIAGGGTLAAAGTRVVVGTGALSGGGTLTALGKDIIPGVAALAGGGALAATGKVVVPGVANVAASGTLAATGVKKVAGVAPLASGGVLAALGKDIIPGVATIAGGGTLAGAGVKTVSGVGALAGGGTLIALGTRIVIGTGAIAGGATLAAVGKDIIPGTASLAGGGTLTSTGKVIIPGSAVLAAGGTLAGTGVKTVAGVGSVLGGGSLAALGKDIIPGTGTIAGGGTLAATGVKTVSGVASIAGGGTLHANGTRVAFGSSSILGGGTLAATGVPIVKGVAAVLAGGVLAGTGVGINPGQGSGGVVGGGTLHAVGTVIVPASSSLAGGGTLHANGTRIVAGSSSIAGGGVLAGAGTARSSGTGIVSGGGTLHATGNDVIPGIAHIDGGGTFSTIGTKVVHGTSSIACGGAFIAVGTKVVHGSASLAGGGVLIARATVFGVGHVLGGGVLVGVGTSHSAAKEPSRAISGNQKSSVRLSRRASETAIRPRRSFGPEIRPVPVRSHDSQ